MHPASQAAPRATGKVPLKYLPRKTTGPHVLLHRLYARTGSCTTTPPKFTAPVAKDRAAQAYPILSIRIKNEHDVFASRQRAKQIAALLGFAMLDQSRISTVVSELARNVFQYAGTGAVAFSIVQPGAIQQLVVTVRDEGPGIADLDAIIEGRYRSAAGLGVGILSARRLMDRFEIKTEADVGTEIIAAKTLPANAARVSDRTIETLLAQLGELPNNLALSDARQHNRELETALGDLHTRQEELMIVSARLEETNQRIETVNAVLAQKARMLVAADDSKNEFMSILSHELRGPLSAAGMAAQVLLAGPSAERAAQVGKIVARQVGHMTRLVEDLLDISRISRGQVLIERAAIDVNEVINDAIEQVTPFAGRKDHTLHIAIPSTPSIVHGDRTRLLQVVGNLLTNAVRYTPDGGRISLNLQVIDRVVVITVADNGIGIAPDLMPNLFELYVQAERPKNGREGGLGLGLALVRNLVEAHDGTVTAESAGVDRGSSFSVRLPMPTL